MSPADGFAPVPSPGTTYPRHPLSAAFPDVERLERLLAAEGDERTTALVADNKRLVALNRTLESRLHGLMEEARAATHDARYWKGRFGRLDRAQRKGV